MSGKRRREVWHPTSSAYRKGATQWERRAARLACGAVAVCVLGCGSDTTGPASRDPATLPWKLTLNYHAVTLLDTAPFDTVRLVPTLETVTGAALPMTNATVTYQTTDASSAVVSATGLVTARGATPLVDVIVTASLGGVSAVDTALLQVNAAADVGNPPPTPTRLVLQGVENPFSSFGFNPPPPARSEGLTVECGTTALALRSVGLVPQILAGTTPTPGMVRFASSDSTILTFESTGQFFGFFFPSHASCQKLGTVTITATALVYGVPLRDSVRVTLIPPLRQIVTVWQHVPRTTGTPVNDFAPGSVTIGAGGIVFWRFETTAILTKQDSTIDVVFDQPPALPQSVDTTTLPPILLHNFPFPPDPAGGDIAPFSPTAPPFTVPNMGDTVTLRARQFPMPGTYHYHSTRYGTTGTIIVRPWTP